MAKGRGLCLLDVLEMLMRQAKPVTPVPNRTLHAVCKVTNSRVNQLLALGVVGGASEAKVGAIISEIELSIGVAAVQAACCTRVR